jgi:hypothetical protein
MNILKMLEIAAAGSLFPLSSRLDKRANNNISQLFTDISHEKQDGQCCLFRKEMHGIHILT